MHYSVLVRGSFPLNLGGRRRIFLVACQVLLILHFLLRPTGFAAEMPAIGIIDYHGLRHVPLEQVQQALQIKVGDRLPDSPAKVQLRLEAIPGIEKATLNGVCCDSGKSILYVGVEEKGSPSLHFRPAPKAKITLAPEIVEAGKALDAAVLEAVERGDAAEDDLSGNALSHNAAVRAIEERYVIFAARSLGELRNALHNSSNAEQRALAAEVLGYASDKRSVVPDLEYGMFDASTDVRNNAMRALALIAGFAQKHPQLRIHIPATPFVSMLNSVVWTDRNKASWALLLLTNNRDPTLIADLRDRALLCLAEMARWQNPGHAQIAFAILGRVAGLSDKQIDESWQRDQRDMVIKAWITSRESRNHR